MAKVTQKVIRVKEYTLDGKKTWGITDGKKWFFYAYSTKERAEVMLEHFNSPSVIEVNISQPQPFKLAREGSNE